MNPAPADEAVESFIFSFVTSDETPLLRLDWRQINWQELTDRIQRSRVPLFMHHILEKSPDLRAAFPETFRAQLKMNYYSVLQEAVFRHEALKEVLDSIKRAAVPAIVLRGDAMAERYYPNPGLRPSMDVDLLIRKKDLERLEKEFSAKGIEPVKEHGEVQLYYRDSPPPVNVDLHTEFWYAPDMEAVWLRSQEKDLSGLKARVLSPEDLFLHLIAHSMIHHGRFSADDAVDIALIVNKERELDWNLIEKETRHSSFKTFIYEALLRVQAVTHYPVSAGIISRFTPHMFERPIYRLIHKLVREEEQPFVSYFFKPLTITGIKGKLGFIAKQLFPPAEFIRERYGLTQSWQTPLVRALRPLLLLINSFRALFTLGLRRASRD